MCEDTKKEASQGVISVTKFINTGRTKVLRFEVVFTTGLLLKGSMGTCFLIKEIES